MSKIRNLEEFETWVKVQMICQRITQRELADKISAHTPRISEKPQYSAVPATDRPPKKEQKIRKLIIVHEKSDTPKPRKEG